MFIVLLYTVFTIINYCARCMLINVEILGSDKKKNYTTPSNFTTQHCKHHSGSVSFEHWLILLLLLLLAWNPTVIFSMIFIV